MILRVWPILGQDSCLPFKLEYWNQGVCSTMEKGTNQETIWFWKTEMRIGGCFFLNKFKTIGPKPEIIVYGWHSILWTFTGHASTLGMTSGFCLVFLDLPFKSSLLSWKNILPVKSLYFFSLYKSRNQQNSFYLATILSFFNLPDSFSIYNISQNCSPDKPICVSEVYRDLLYNFVFISIHCTA